MNFFLVIQIIFSELFQITVKTLYWPKFLPRRRNFKRTCQNADVPLFKNYTLFLVFFWTTTFYCSLFCVAYESDEDEYGDEHPATCGLGEDVSIADSGHGHHQHVTALPVGQDLGVGEVHPHVATVLNLQHTTCILN